MDQSGNLEQIIETIVIKQLSQRQYVVEDREIEKQRYLKQIGALINQLVNFNIQILLDPIIIQVQHLETELQNLKCLVISNIGNIGNTNTSMTTTMNTSQSQNIQGNQDTQQILHKYDTQISMLLENQYIIIIKLQSKWNEQYILSTNISDKIESLNQVLNQNTIDLGTIKHEMNKKFQSFWIALNTINEQIEKQEDTPEDANQIPQATRGLFRRVLFGWNQ